MNKVKKDTRWLTSVALMAAVVILLANTPLGMIQLPIIKATTVHIPVILGAILLGPMAGAILGAVFGVCSLISNTVTPCVFSFYEYDGNVRSSKSSLDLCRMPDDDWNYLWMVLDFGEKM